MSAGHHAAGCFLCDEEAAVSRDVDCVGGIGRFDVRDRAGRSGAGVIKDDVEISVRGRLHDPLAPLGLGKGDPAFADIEVKAFASTLDDEERVRAAWERTLALSPLFATLAKATQLSARLAIV